MHPRLTCAAILICTFAAATSALADGTWDRGFGGYWSPYTPADVQEWNGDLYVGAGDYSDVSTGERDLAVWDGGRWTTVTGFSVGMIEPGQDRGARNWKLDVHAGRLLVAASDLDWNAAPGPTRGYLGRVAAWDGSSWMRYGPDLHACIEELVVYEGSPIVLARSYVGSNATDDQVLRWDGAAWNAITGAGCDLSDATALAGGELFVSGSIHTLDGVMLDGILAWDGLQWRVVAPQPAAGPARSLIYAMGNLIAGCSGRLPDDELIERWTGTEWQPLGDGIHPGSNPYLFESVQGMLESGDKLIVCGRFQTAGREEAANVAAWDGSHWRSYGGGVDGIAGGLSRWRDRLVVFGGFYYANDRYVSGLALDSDAGWEEPRRGDAIAGRVLSFFETPERLWALGSFSAAGGQRLGSPATWDGFEWSAVPRGADVQGIRDLTFHDGRIFAAGRFAYSQADTTAMSALAWLDGETWVAIPGDWGEVGATTLCSWGAHGIAVAVRNADSGRAEILLWDGAAVQRFSADAASRIRALTVFRDRLVVGGVFREIGGTSALMIAAYDGTIWSPLAGGVGGEVACLLSDGQSLFVGGHFNVVGGTVQARSIASWDGNGWSTLGEGFEADSLPYGAKVAVVGDLTLHRGELVATGWFQRSGDRPMGGIARWDGSRWQPIGNAPDIGIERFGEDYAVASWKGDLYVGGAILSVEGINSKGIARWIEFSPSVASHGVGLRSIRPNPMNPVTTIEFEVTREDQVRVEIYDSRGRLVCTLSDAWRPAGRYVLPWSGRDAAGRAVASGVYFVRVRGSSGADRGKVTLLK